MHKASRGEACTRTRHTSLLVRAHLIRELELEGGQEHGHSGLVVDLGQVLADAVTRADAEGREALDPVLVLILGFLSSCGCVGRRRDMDGRRAGRAELGARERHILCTGCLPPLLQQPTSFMLVCAGFAGPQLCAGILCQVAPFLGLWST